LPKYKASKIAPCRTKGLSGCGVCKLFKTHNADPDLRSVRKRVRMMGIQLTTVMAIAANDRKYKVTQLLPSQIPAARKPIVGKGA
jgi:hypothetical protein